MTENVKTDENWVTDQNMQMWKWRMPISWVFQENCLENAHKIVLPKHNLLEK